MARILLLYVLPAALMIYALVDCAQDDEVERTSVPKLVWILLIVLISPYVGALAWLIVSKVAKPRRNKPARRQPPRPLAPDDNPEFLRRLAQDQMRKDRNRRSEDGKPDS